VDTAVRILANMVGLQVVKLENVLFVTTENRAKPLLDEQKAAEEKMAKQLGVLGGAMLGGPGGQPGGAGVMGGGLGALGGGFGFGGGGLVGPPGGGALGIPPGPSGGK
jgi:hypothetical protein